MLHDFFSVAPKNEIKKFNTALIGYVPRIVHFFSFKALRVYFTHFALKCDKCLNRLSFINEVFTG